LSLLGVRAFAYDYPLTSTAIRDAYFEWRREGGLAPSFLAKYSKRTSELHQGSCTSEVRIEAPFFQVTESTSTIPSYSSRDAVKEFILAVRAGCAAPTVPFPVVETVAPALRAGLTSAAPPALLLVGVTGGAFFVVGNNQVAPAHVILKWKEVRRVQSIFSTS
jgi:hypothetical protein